MVLPQARSYGDYRMLVVRGREVSATAQGQSANGYSSILRALNPVASRDAFDTVFLWFHIVDLGEAASVIEQPAPI